jgi:ABC-type taurine transport system ATPase subunit
VNFLNTLRGKALIISGPQGCGKSVLALEMVQAHGGKYGATTQEALYRKFGVARALSRSPDVVIVDDVVPDEAFFELAKVLASEDLIEVQPKGRSAYMAKNPIWVFTTHLPVELPEDSRRFTVITLNAS